MSYQKLTVGGDGWGRGLDMCECRGGVPGAVGACLAPPPTCDAAVGLLDVVEPEGGQVQHLAGLHAAAQRLRPPVLGVLLQVRVQGVQGDPRDLVAVVTVTLGSGICAAA